MLILGSTVQNLSPALPNASAGAKNFWEPACGKINGLAWNVIFVGWRRHGGLVVVDWRRADCDGSWRLRRADWLVVGGLEVQTFRGARRLACLLRAPGPHAPWER